MMQVLVTGSAGAVGQAVCRELVSRGHRVRGLDRVATQGLDEAVVADVTDAEAVRAATRGTDAVVHLAAHRDDAPFTTLLGPNVVGLYNVMSAAREEKVRRVVLASTLQVTWTGRDPDDPPRPARVDEARPSNHYALTKLWAEQMGEMYARCYDMSVVVLRLTWMVRNPAEARRMQEFRRPKIFLSSRDAGRAFAAAVEAQDIRFAVVFVAGPDGAGIFDLEPARRLIGFVPQDRWPEGLAFDFPQEG
jgi:uronate dehydrogenase